MNYFIRMRIHLNFWEVIFTWTLVEFSDGFSDFFKGFVAWGRQRKVAQFESR